MGRLNGTISCAASGGSTHFQASNSGCAVAILAAPQLGAQLRRQIVAQPDLGLGQDDRLARADLLLELAQGGLLGRFAVIDAALRHLPGVGRVEAPRDEDLAGAVDQHDPDILAVQRGIEIERRALAHFGIIAVAGASRTFFDCSCFTHSASRSIVVGCGAANPTAWPDVRAWRSSSPSRTSSEPRVPSASR